MELEKSAFEKEAQDLRKRLKQCQEELSGAQEDIAKARRQVEAFTQELQVERSSRVSIGTSLSET